MRIFLEERDNLHIRNYLATLPGIQLVDIGTYQLHELVEKLLAHKVEVVIQIAPQWQWGKYVEQIAKDIMNANIKLLSGEGAMFRWLGDVRECGADIGFYLSPWGYSGNSKIAHLQPNYTPQDESLARRIISQQPHWKPNATNGKILVAGQLENDRSRMYCRKIHNNSDLLNKVLEVHPADQVVFRKHPLDTNDYHTFNVLIDEGIEPLLKSLNSYAGFISANSTSTIEAMSIGIPIFNFEVSPWHACMSVNKGERIQLTEHPIDVYIQDIAGLLHLHYLCKFNWGNPLHNALNFYSEYDPAAFTYLCSDSEFQPTQWDESIRFQKY